MKWINLMPCSCSCTPFNKLSIHSMKFMFYTHYKDINCFMPIHSIDLILHTLFWWPEEKHVILTQRHYITRSIKMNCIVSQNIIILHWCAYIDYNLDWWIEISYVSMLSLLFLFQKRVKYFVTLTTLCTSHFEKVFSC